MTKSSRKQIKKDEKSVILELQKNSRGNIGNMSDNVGFSRQKLWKIINKLEENKTIWGYTTIVDDEKQDLNHYTMLIKRTNLPYDSGIINNLDMTQLDNLASETGVKIEDCLYVHGNYDWILSFTAPDIRQVKKFYDRLSLLLKRHISGLEILETLIPLKKKGIKNPNVERFKDFL